MNTDLHLQRLEGFGYTPRHAAFLRLVLLFGGYFVRRHVTAFLGGGDGGVTTGFVRDLVRRGHGTCGVYRCKTQVVHVFAKRLYAALDEPDNRNRRTVEPTRILRKLLTLDVVLAHRTEPFLATTREKIAYFLAAGIPMRALPTTRYRARHRPGPPTVRSFVDKAPIWLARDGRQVVLAYVRTPIEGTDAMRTWLAAYAPLLARLPEPGLVLVTTSDDEAAESVAVAHAVLHATTIDTTPTVAEWRAQMEEYLEARRRLDQGDLCGLSADRLATLRVVRTRFPDHEHEALYRTYRSWGPTVLYDLMPVRTVRRLSHVVVDREVIPVRYELFGTQHRRPPRRAASSTFARICGIDVSQEPAA